MRINADGTKVSLTFNISDEGDVYHSSSSIYVYDVEMDKVTAHNFGPNYYPVPFACTGAHGSTTHCS